jgi:hypothetical protein
VTFELKRAAAAVGALLLAAWACPPAGRPIGRNAGPPGAPEISAALLGGGRGLAADALWLATYRAWAVRDARTTAALIRLTTALDDRPLCFWLNGARMLAYDVTQWRIDAAAADGPVPAAVRARIAAEQAALALDYLDAATRSHPRNAALWVEMANIHLHLRGDPAAAARCYREAALLPGAPHYAGRIYGELLRRMGRPAEAYAWLCALHATLPPGDMAAMPGVVLARIRALEAVLAITPERRFAPRRRWRRPRP